MKRESYNRDHDSEAHASERRLISICILLFLLVFGVFYPITGDDFINYDDNDYVTDNAHVQGGLIWQKVMWAFTNTDAANWHPLTWLSHMLDCQLYGMKPWDHHLTSVLIHAANAVLVFVVIRGMTGVLWRSLFVALLFGLHPLRVESVAWIAERKDVLSAMFWLLAMWSYLGYTSNKTPRPAHATVNYWLALLCTALGLMSKPMVVTLPFALLLLDYWPLRRMTPDNAGRLAWEKAPFFLLATAGSMITFLAQKSQGAVIEYLPLGHRIETVIMAYTRYLGKFLYPVNLAILYPHPVSWSLANVVGALFLFVAISAAVFVGRRSRPYCVTGWLWYVGTLVPVIGIVQVGSQSLADRYSYVPGLGLIIILTWGACDLARSLPGKTLVLGSVATAVILGCIALTRHQISFWKDSGTVFSHAVAVTDNSYVARKALADFYSSQHRTDEAIALYREALRMHPKFEEAHVNLGAVLSQAGHPNEAKEEFKQAIRLKPNDANAYNDLGAILGSGHIDESMALFEKAVELNPGYVDARKNLGQALDAEGRIAEAVAQYQEAVRLRPDPDAHYLLGLDLEKLGRDQEAIIQLTEALKGQPDNPPAQRALERLKKRVGS